MKTKCCSVSVIWVKKRTGSNPILLIFAPLKRSPFYWTMRGGGNATQSRAFPLKLMQFAFTLASSFPLPISHSLCSPSPKKQKILVKNHRTIRDTSYPLLFILMILRRCNIPQRSLFLSLVSPSFFFLFRCCLDQNVIFPDLNQVCIIRGEAIFW